MDISSVFDFLFRIGAFIVVVGLIVLLHELGHFLTARLVGIRVIRFSIGFPPKLFSWQRKQTEYQIGMIPFGGYVKMAGIIDESFGDEESKTTGAPDEFASKNVWQKSLVLSGGVLMNLISAWVLAVGLVMMQGKPEINQAIVGDVVKGMPSETLGLKSGDKIITINDAAIAKWEQLTEIIHQSAGKELTFRWLRGADTLTGSTIPLERAITDPKDGTKKVGLIGISPHVEYVPIGIADAVTDGSKVTWGILSGSLMSFKMLFTGQASVKELVGPIGIVQMSGESAKSGLSSFWGFIILISISVGVLNILPLPVLDGGHIVIAWIEHFRGSPVPVIVRLRIQQAGMMLLAALVLFVSYHDIIRIWSSN